MFLIELALRDSSRLSWFCMKDAVGSIYESTRSVSILTIRVGTKEAPVGGPLISAAQLVGDVRAPVAVLRNNAELILSACEHLAGLVVLLCHLSF